MVAGARGINGAHKAKSRVIKGLLGGLGATAERVPGERVGGTQVPESEGPDSSPSSAADEQCDLGQVALPLWPQFPELKNENNK